MAFDDDGTLAGWHHDPSGRHELRFWNGDRWTEHVIDDGVPGLDAPTRSGRPAATMATTAPPPPPDLELDLERELEREVAMDAVVIDPVAEPETSVIDLEAETEADVEAEIASTVASRLPVAEPRESGYGGASLRTARRAAPASPSPQSPREPWSGSIDPTTDPVSAVTSPPDVEPAIDEPVIEVTAIDEPVIEAPGFEVPVVSEPTVSEPTVSEPTVEVFEAPPSEPPPSEPPPSEPPPSEPPYSEPPASDPPAPSAPAPAPHAPESDIVEPDGRHRPRSVISGPTVASPAGNSAGSNTSAIADPHGAPVSASSSNAPDAPRVAGVAPVPVKRYRPGSPPPSPFARPVALPAASGPVGTTIAPWYRKPIAWVAIVAVAALTAVGVVVITNRGSNSTGTSRLGGRPPAAAPQGSKVIDGDGFGIAAPKDWITTTDPGDNFPQLRHTNWGTPLAAIATTTREGLLVVPLHDLAHSPQVDPELFWSDQVVDPEKGHPIEPGPPFGVHGYRANRVTITDLSGIVMEAASIDTGDRSYLVAVTGPNAEAASTRFERFIQTFDVR